MYTYGFLKDYLQSVSFFLIFVGGNKKNAPQAFDVPQNLAEYLEKL